MVICFGFRFDDGSNGYYSNYMYPLAIDDEAQAYLDAWDKEHKNDDDYDESLTHLYEEYPLEQDVEYDERYAYDDEYNELYEIAVCDKHAFTGFRQMVDSLTEKLSAIGFPLKRVWWPYGTHADGSPVYIDDVG